MLVPVANWNDAKLQSFCRSLDEITDRLRRGEKVTRPLVQAIARQNRAKEGTDCDKRRSK